MRSTHFPVFAVCATLAAAQVPAAGPDGDRPPFGSEVEVTVANLDVFVRDRDGRPVHGLTAEDFRILQDGVEMQMSNFTALSGGGTHGVGFAAGSVLLQLFQMIGG